MKRIALILFLLISVSPGFSQNSGNITLSKGQKFSVDNKVVAVTTQTLMGQNMESNAELTTKCSIDVKDLKDNTYTLSGTFTKMKMKMSAMGNDMNFDSDKKEDMAGEYAASFKDILNKPREVIINRNGKIIKTKESEIKPSDTQPDMMKMMTEQLLGDPEETGYGVTTIFVPVPPNIAAGYNWTDSSDMYGMKRSTTYRVKEIKGNEAVVTIAGTLQTDVKTQMQGMDITNKSSGSLTGEEILDITTGMIKESTTKLESSGTIEAQGLQIPMTTKITFTYTVKPV